MLVVVEHCTSFIQGPIENHNGDVGLTLQIAHRLHWQTGWFTVWANGKQNTRLK